MFKVAGRSKRFLANLCFDKCGNFDSIVSRRAPGLFRPRKPVHYERTSGGRGKAETELREDACVTKP